MALRGYPLLLSLACVVARHRLAPPSGTVIHAAGQEPGEFEAYSAFLAPSGVAPAVKMFYLGLASLNTTAPGTLSPWFASAAAALAADAAPDGAFIAMQLGLELPLNGEERRVADGEYANAIEALRFALVALARPVWLRVGYEFNGGWNGYAPATYVGAFRRIAAALHADPTLNQTVALVWDGSCDTAVDPTPFFPGADVVDWQGVNLFSDGSAPEAAAGSCVWYWLTDSAAAGIPLMIGESTPRFLFTNASGTLAKWHAPLLSLLSARRPGLVSYISGDWTTAEGGRWSTWGDSRIQVATDDLKAAWVSGLSQPQFFHRAQRAQLLGMLGLPIDVFDKR